VIAAPGFYAERLGPGVLTHDELIGARLAAPVAAAVRRSAMLRGLALGACARRGDRVALIRRERGTLPALFVCAVAPARSRPFVLELLRRPLPRSRWRRLAHRAWLRAVERPLLRRGLEGAQVMSGFERREYAALYGLDPERLTVVPWAWREGGDGAPAAVEDGASEVFSSGRSACDWPTLFAAAAGRDWRLTVACAEADAADVRELARPVGARVLVEVPWAEHDRELRRARVCVLALADRGVSAGQVRLMAAVEAGVPVVCTELPTLADYVVAGETAEVVPAGDEVALGERVDALLADPARRLALRDAARARAGRWTYADYFARLRELIAPSGVPSEAGRR